MRAAPSSVEDWPGQRLGLPAQGPGSVGRVGRRVAALVIDWIACSVIAVALTGDRSWLPLVVFVVEQSVLVAAAGAGFGHALVGLRVRRLDGRRPGVGAAVVRAVLIAVVFPPLVYDADQRGQHDRAAGTVLVRR